MLRNSRQFRQVYDQGQRFHTPFFSIFILERDSNEQRIGITVTRKIGNAVVRNRCKRRLREVLRKHLNDAAGLVGFDLVINARSNLIQAEFQQIMEALGKVIGRFQKSSLKVE